MRQFIKIIIVAMAFASFGCAGESIFKPVPLTLDPVVLVNPISMALNPAANRLYVANSNNTVLYADASFVVFDISNPLKPLPISVISIPSFAGQMILDTVRGFIYLPDRLSDNDADDVDQVLRININEASPQFLAVDVFNSAANPFGAFYDGVDTLYVAATDNALRYNVDNMAGFTAVDLAVTTAQGRLIEALETRELGLTPSGNFLFVTNQTDNMLILDVAEFTAPPATGVLPIGTESVDYIVTGTDSTRGVARDSNFIYVVDGSPPALKIMTDANLVPIVGAPQEIPASSLQVAAIPVGTDPGEVVVDEPNHRAYVANTGTDDISVIDTNLQTEITRIAVDDNLPPRSLFGDAPFALAVGNLGGVNYLYVANFDNNVITIIDADALHVVATFPDF